MFDPVISTRCNGCGVDGESAAASCAIADVEPMAMPMADSAAPMTT